MNRSIIQFQLLKTICFLRVLLIAVWYFLYHEVAVKEVPSYLLDTGLAGLLMRAQKGPAQLRFDPPPQDMWQKVSFYLYTRNNPVIMHELWLGDVKSLKYSHFDPAKDTFILVHGYLSNINSNAIQLPKKNLLVTYDCNIIGVDWSSIAVTIYYNDAAAETVHVGYFLSRMIRFLVSEGNLDLNRTQLVGHSLGAHVVGFTGKDLAPQRLARITGLDPAKPGFTGVSPSKRLDASDALFVDCIHTCSADLGIKDPICQANFYPNGGINPQPGCFLFAFTGWCSHERSVDLYAESILPKHMFRAAVCTTIPNRSGKNCGVYDDLMGQPASNRLPGIFYVKTRSEYPFSMIVKP